MERRDLFLGCGAAAVFVGMAATGCSAAETVSQQALSSDVSAARLKAISASLRAFSEKGVSEREGQIRLASHRNAARAAFSLQECQHFGRASFAQVGIKLGGAAESSTQYLMFNFDADNNVTSVGMV